MGVVYQKDPVRILRRRLVGAGLIVVVALLLNGVWNVYHKERESRKLRNDAELKLQTLSERESQLRANIANLKTDRGVETVLRQGYELGKEGEGVIVFVEPETIEVPEIPTTLQKIKSIFGW